MTMEMLIPRNSTFCLFYIWIFYICCKTYIKLVNLISKYIPTKTYISWTHAYRPCNTALLLILFSILDVLLSHLLGLGPPKPLHAMEWKASMLTLCFLEERNTWRCARWKSLGFPLKMTAEWQIEKCPHNHVDLILKLIFSLIIETYSRLNAEFVCSNYCRWPC